MTANFQPDQFFDANQLRRLKELMDVWRQARDLGNALPAGEQRELDNLIEAELLASASRAAMLADKAGR